MSHAARTQPIQAWLRSSGSSEHVAQGQFVIVAARWVLVLAGLVLTLWLPAGIGELRLQIVVLLLLAVVNFYLHAQLLMNRPTADSLAYIASAADIVVITLLVAQGGAGSSLYIFYLPALVAISVAFPTEVVFTYAAVAMLFYASIFLYDLDMAPSSTEAQTLVARLLMFAALAVCGNLYWRIERGRRQDRERDVVERNSHDEALDVIGLTPTRSPLAR